jgi:hypothetical protein
MHRRFAFLLSATFRYLIPASQPRPGRALSSRRRSWDSALRSLAPARGIRGVSIPTSPHAVFVIGPPRWVFVEEPAVCTSSVFCSSRGGGLPGIGKPLGTTAPDDRRVQQAGHGRSPRLLGFHAVGKPCLVNGDHRSIATVEVATALGFSYRWVPHRSRDWPAFQIRPRRSLLELLVLR